MTATDETGQTKGGNEEVKVNGSTKLEEKTSTEPGSLAERPMGDAPPPKNEELADDVAPTFEVSIISQIRLISLEPSISSGFKGHSVRIADMTLPPKKEYALESCLRSAISTMNAKGSH